MREQEYVLIIVSEGDGTEAYIPGDRVHSIRFKTRDAAGQAQDWLAGRNIISFVIED